MNPYSPKHPADPEFFANRKDKIEQFEKFLRMSAERKPPKPENMAILGAWGVGKTSLIKKLEDICKQNEKYAIFTATVPITTEAGKNLSALSEHIYTVTKNAYKTTGKLEKAKDWVKNQVKKWEVEYVILSTTPEAKIIKTEKQEKKINLEETLMNLWENISPKTDLMILFLDDIHLLSEATHQDIRNIFQSLAIRKANIMLVITAPEQIFELKQVAEPFRRFFDTYTLTPFDYEGTKNMIQLPLKKMNSNLKISEQATKRIHELTQGHPYFIACIMRELYELKPEGEITAQFFSEKYPAIIKQIEANKFKADYDELPETEKTAMLKIAKTETEKITPKDIKTHPEHLKRLSEKGYLTKISRGEYKIYHPLFKEYLNKIK